MPDETLTRLRNLRDRAQALLDKASSDLKPFVREDGTFRRKPDSSIDLTDSNVTTTCSCLMALLMTGKSKTFFEDLDNTDEISPKSVFKKIVDSPWMSSGLPPNNSFTATLIIRTAGFLVKKGNSEIKNVAKRNWYQTTKIDSEALASNLRSYNEKPGKNREIASYIWDSLTDKLRFNISKGESGQSSLPGEIYKICENGSIYTPSRFPKASKALKKRVLDRPTSYNQVDLNWTLLASVFKEIEVPSRKTLTEIAELLARDLKAHFAINGYQASPAVIYWFVDGIQNSKIEFDPELWIELSTWATDEFTRQRSLVMASHDALMDPVAMTMAACLCARLRSISEQWLLGSSDKSLGLLPSLQELQSSIIEMIHLQGRSGIWSKYFPMFHYQDAGSNFCFTFELLEAVLCEFGCAKYDLLKNEDFLTGLERSLDWCEKNRLICAGKHEKMGPLTEYSGWNSGGQLDSLKKNQPESWATAVVHMFLWELTNAVSNEIQDQILAKYKARFPAKADFKGLKDGLLDIQLHIKDKNVSLIEYFTKNVIDVHKVSSDSSSDLNTLRFTGLKKKKALSAILFGPPGTSKTEIVKAIAKDLDWPLLEITPSDFVRETLANVHTRVDDVFDDLLDLTGVIVFFDEMDALVQTRDSKGQLDLTSQFLTTSMLPKLTKLHDQRRVIFFMATNHQEKFDSAIKRSGRFDLLICMGPPTADEKLGKISLNYPELNKHMTKLKIEEDSDECRKIIQGYLNDSSSLKDQFELLTFGEYKSLLRTLGSGKKLSVRLKTLKQDGFAKILLEEGKMALLKETELRLVQFELKVDTLDLLKKKKTTLEAMEAIYKDKGPMPDVVRYVCDWSQSKEQF